MSFAAARIFAPTGAAASGTTFLVNVRAGPTDQGVDVSAFAIYYVRTRRSQVVVDWGDGEYSVVTPDSDGRAGVNADRPLEHVYRRSGRYVVALDRGVYSFMLGVGARGLAPIEQNEAYSRFASYVEKVLAWSPATDFEADHQVLYAYGLPNIDKATPFKGCVNLSEIAACPLTYLPPQCFSGVTQVGDFSELVSSTSVLDIWSFADSGITDVSWWPSDANVVPRACFQNCTALASLAGMSSVETVDAHAFEGCTALQSAAGTTASPGLVNCTTLGDFAFRNSGLATKAGLENVVSEGTGCFDGTPVAGS